MQLSVPQQFKRKQDARKWVWDRMEADGVARFPFPPHDRIPNFEGAAEAAVRFVDSLDLRQVHRVKVNPDAPQRALRALLLEKGVTVFVPTPRLKGGFKVLEPERIPADKRKAAAGLSQMDRWARTVPLRELPRMDWIVTGSVAVTTSGRRAGKGEGFSDIEYALLRELGHPETPVATTVHEVQVVEDLPLAATDLPLSLIVTPERLIDVRTPPSAPRGIHWDLLDEGALRRMPVLRELQAARPARHG